MSDSVPQNIPPAWYPDPAGGPNQRWWDGTQWTDHYQQPYSPGVAAAALKAPEGIPVYNVWIWLVTLLPLLSFVSFFTVDYTDMFTFDINDPYSAYNSQFAVLSSPGYILSVVGGWVIFGLGVFFSFLDWRTLNRLGVPRPFHWAFGFLGVVYPIGRSVVIRRRTGRGIAPMWISIAIIVLSVIFSIVFSIILMNAMFSSIMEQVPLR